MLHFQNMNFLGSRVRRISHRRGQHHHQLPVRRGIAIASSHSQSDILNGRRSSTLAVLIFSRQGHLPITYVISCCAAQIYPNWNGWGSYIMIFGKITSASSVSRKAAKAQRSRKETMSSQIVDRLAVHSFCFRSFTSNEQVIGGLKECGVRGVELSRMHLNPIRFRQESPRRSEIRNLRVH